MQVVNMWRNIAACLKGVYFLALDKNITGSSSKEDHKRGQCVFKDQIIRFLLHQVSSKKDKGASVKLLLDKCLRDNEVWYEQMGKNF